MTGTSLDGLDVAIVQIVGQGLLIQPRLLGSASLPLGGLADTLRQLAAGEPASPVTYLQAARQLGELHRDAVWQACQTAGVPKPDLVAAHGQTIWHAPQQHLSLQLLDPWPIVRGCACAVVYDLRQADLIAGGQGAPITPLSDWIMYQSRQTSRAVVNLGGICNVTLLPKVLPTQKDHSPPTADSPAQPAAPGSVIGFDVGPCNLLLDGLLTRSQPDCLFDQDGHIASQGQPGPRVYDHMVQHPFFARALPRTTGREDFNAAWLDTLYHQLSRQMDLPDLLAGAADAIARSIAQAAASADEIILAGGGARNTCLVQRITQHVTPKRVLLSDQVGWPIGLREAAGFAVLGALCQDGIAITLTQVTGSNQPGRAGCWVYP